MEIVKRANGSSPSTASVAGTCGTCPYWNAIDAMKAKQLGNPNGGQCRFAPPVNHLMPVETLQGQQLGVNGFWPATGSDQWCGKHPLLAAEINAAILAQSVEFLQNKSAFFAGILKQAGFSSQDIA